MIKNLYIHIPFCRKKCFYCDFYSISNQPELVDQYLKVICRQIKTIPEKLNTIYLGGGTPSILDLNSLQRLLKVLKPKLADDCEFTVEANPESLTFNKAKIMSDYGVNRISIGLQSLSDHKLRFLGRIHNAAKGLASLAIAQKAGFKNISADLIFGLPDESLSDLAKELASYAQLGIKHISAYGLSYEPGTILQDQVKNKKIVPITDELFAQMYTLVIKTLKSNGFYHYEVSNFAKPDFLCRHNLNYWENNSYYGIGAGAFGYDHKTRYKNVADVREYIKRSMRNEKLTDFKETIVGIARAHETAAIKIRVKEGIDFNWFNQATGYDLRQIAGSQIAELIRLKLIKLIIKNKIQTGICLTNKGFLFCDEVSSRLV